MPYVKRTTRAGRTVEVEYYYTSRYNRKGQHRADKIKPTDEAQKKINKRQAERKLRLLINENFSYGDYHVVLDYIRKPDTPDRTKEEMKQDIAVFLREARKLYRKNGKELKYIHVMETGKKGARHHHLVINKLDTELLQQAWYKAYDGHNRIKVFPLDDSGNYADLAAYLIKYTDEHRTEEDGALMGKRYNCSKNLVRPEPEYEIVTSRSYYKVSQNPQAPKGYYILPNSIEQGITSPEYYGYGWYRYTMIKLEQGGQDEKHRKRRKNTNGNTGTIDSNNHYGSS